MKNLCLAFCLCAVSFSSVLADTGVTVNGAPVIASNINPVGVPPPVSALSDGAHFLDNVIPGGCRDVIQGQWLGCTGEALYKQYYTSLDAVYAIPINGSGFFSPGVRVYVGQLLLEQIPALKKSAESNLVLTSALNYLTAGGFYTRDFGQGINRAGYYMGVLVKFGG
jgi:hypothetical protein